MSSGTAEEQLSHLAAGVLPTLLLRTLGVVAVLTLPFVSGLSPAGETPSGLDRGESLAWKQSWSERYPGCVPTVLWPAEEMPVAVVIRTLDGRLERVELDAQRRPVQPLAEGARAVGACR